jgi:hypothetical protein
VAEDRLQGQQAASCGCTIAPHEFLVNDTELGMDADFAQVSLLVCPACGRHWLRYFYELEAFTASGRWYLGAITAEQVSNLTAENAKGTLESLSWYFYGGSYYGGQSGRTSGRIYLNP